MRNYKKYRSVTLDLFKLFLAEKIDKKGLILGLISVESIISKGKETDKNLWFRFFSVDPSATTIRDLNNDLTNYVNDNYVKECMQIAIDNPKGLQIYYS